MIVIIPCRWNISGVYRPKYGITRRHMHIPISGQRESSHIVQFYDSDQFLAATATEFLGNALAAEIPILIVATEPHRTLLLDGLAARGFDVAAAIRTGELLAVDAAETLATFMVNDVPDPAQFRATAEVLLGRMNRGGGRARVGIYGEMVDLLWKAGNRAAAIRLEELWNALAAEHVFSLFCAYAMSNFRDAAHAASFQKICRQHQSVFPADDREHPRNAG